MSEIWTQAALWLGLALAPLAAIPPGYGVLTQGTKRIYIRRSGWQ